MNQKLNNVAYIDGANLHKGITSLGWELDYRNFYRWLEDKYSIRRAYIFLGMMSEYASLYNFLQKAGFVVLFKEVTFHASGAVKGNCDTDLVLKAARDYYEGRLSKAVIVSSDGDYACLVDFLKEKQSIRSLISPRNKCSFLLRKLNVPIVYLDSQRRGLSRKRKSP